jgi:hypothetical protein
MEPDSTRRKALLAIAFTGSMLVSQLSTLSQNETKPTSSPVQPGLSNTVVQHFVEGPHGTPEIRAYFLLTLAAGYLAGHDKKQLEEQYIGIVPTARNDRFFSRGGRENILVGWADKISSEECNPSNQLAHKATTDAAALANHAIFKALQILESSSAKFEQLNMLFIASRLYKQSGNIEEMHRCDAALEQAIRTVEESSTVPEGTIKAASSVLNSMAYGIVPIHIPDQDPSKTHLPREVIIHQPSKKEIKESERLKLRALALVDRLPATDHVRRKAHRDLALWYVQVGKPVLAEKQKLILFQLVGFKSDYIMYGHPTGCGIVTWWDQNNKQFSFDCGMG